MYSLALASRHYKYLYMYGSVLRSERIPRTSSKLFFTDAFTRVDQFNSKNLSISDSNLIIVQAPDLHFNRIALREKIILVIIY